MVVPWSTYATANHNITNLNQLSSGRIGTGPLRPELTGGPRYVRAQSGADEGQLRFGNTSNGQQNDEEGEGEEAGREIHGNTQSQNETGSREAGTRASKNRFERKTALQIASLNINGFGNFVRDHPDNKWGRIYRMMSEHRIGVLMLQETHLTDERVASIHKMFARKIRVFFSANPDAPTQREGVAIVLNTKYLDTASAKSTVVVPGKAIQVKVTCQGGDTKNLLCIYAPTSNGVAERQAFFGEVRKYYEEHTECPKPHLMAGDFNNVEDAVDRLPISEGPDRSVDALDELKMYLGLMLADGWRTTFPTVRAYTFHRGTGANATFSRLDRMYVTPRIFDSAREWRICEAGVRTDHSLVLVQLTPENAPVVGQGRPTFPLQLIKDKKLAKEIKTRGLEAMRELTEIETLGIRSKDVNPQRVLYTFKLEVMKMAREREKKVIPRLIAEIETRERALKQVMAKPDLEEDARAKEAEPLTKQIRQLRQQRYKQQQQNSRATHRLYGDRPTRYWSKLHRESAPRDVINAFEKEDSRGVAGEKIYEQDSTRMADMARTHHMNVQRDDETVKPPNEREVDIIEALGSLEVEVSSDQAGELEGSITYEECELSLRFAKSGTSPGLDGVPFELWKALHARHIEDSRFPDRADFDIIRLLTAAFEDIRIFGVDPWTSFAHGWIAPIYKEKGERTRVVNYRPITLLNTDYKILSKVLAIRLAEVAPCIIHKSQAGFVPGRKIYNHTQLTKMMMYWAEKNDEDGAIIALDQEKAYDKVAHDYLWRVLAKFRIPNRFIKMTQSLYRNAKTSIMINGVLSRAYQIFRGVRQGDPMSCLLFDLAIEPLSAMIRQSEIKGFSIPRCNEALKAVLFADDTTVYLSSQDDFNSLQKVLDIWCSAAKAKFNISKTEIIPIGSAEFRKEMAETYRVSGAWKNYPRGVHVAQEGEAIRILGAFFGNGIRQTDVWSLVLTKIVAMRQPLMQVMARWKAGHATIQGKRHVVQMIVGGMTQYLTTVQRMPEPILRRLNKIIRGYLWDDRHNTLVGLSHLYLPVERGGLGLVDLEARNEAIDVMWLKTYLNFGEDRPLWALLADDIMANHVPKHCMPRISELRINPHLQKWKPRARGLPQELSGMMKAAKRYGLRLEGLAFSKDILKAMPMWDHCYADRTKMSRLTVPSKLLTCLIVSHKARTVGDFATLARFLGGATHRPTRTCMCVNCRLMREANGCMNPHLCYVRAKELIGTLPHKWNPFESQPGDHEREEMEGIRRVRGNEGLVPFDRCVTTCGDLGQAFRIFTDKEPVSNGQLAMTLEEDGNSMTIATDGSCLENGERTAQAGAGVYVEGRHELNQSIRLPDELEQSNQTGEMTAVILAASTADERTRVIIETDSQTSMDALTKWKPKHEDQGYILQENAELTKVAIARLRMRKAHTMLKWVKGHAGHTRNEEADKLAAAGAAKANSFPLNLEIPAQFRVTGAKLQKMTQKLAYRAIRAKKDGATKSRPRAEANIDRIVSGIEAAYGTHPQEGTIWKSLRKRHVSRAASQFMWMAIHDGYMIGTHWLRPKMSAELQERALCAVCGECESMTHILLECEAIGQGTLWDLLRQFWSITKADWKTPSWGTALGAACAVFKTENGARRTEIEHLWCILCTETLHLIWKLRCERVIQNEGTQFTKREVTNRFYATIEARLNLDRRTAAMAKGKKALKPKDVEAIWRPVINDVDNLPPNWVTKSGVLVGIKRGR